MTKIINLESAIVNLTKNYISKFKQDTDHLMFILEQENDIIKLYPIIDGFGDGYPSYLYDGNNIVEASGHCLNSAYKNINKILIKY